MSGSVDLGWTLGHVASVVNGTLHGDPSWRVSRVSTDSRVANDGALFLALRGDRFDGHAFVAEAIARGAAGVIVDRPVDDTPTPHIVVPDTLQALLALAADRRGELAIPVVAVTGSSGKTSTKDLIASGIDGSWASPRSFNNEIGVPLTVLGTPSDATAMVLEVGSRGPGHIASLASAIHPQVSVVTNLGVAHLEWFGTLDDLANAKYEIIEMLPPDGVAVVPENEPRLRRRVDVDRITFGVGCGDVQAQDVQLDAGGFPRFVLASPGGKWQVRLAVAGAHQASNAAAATAAAIATGIDIDAFIEGMSHATGSAWRMDVHRGRYTVVNDAYNANPESLRSALDTVAAMEARHRYAVLGPMRELGGICEESHRAMAAHAAALGFDRVVVVGEDHGYVLGAPELVVNATDSTSALDTLLAVVEPGDVVLVKASRASGLERLALELAEDAAR